MSAPDPAPPPARRRLAFWFAAAPLALATLAALFPGSPAYLPDLLRPKVMYDGRRTADWLEQLDSADPEQRCRAIFALGAIGPDAEEAVPALAGILQSDADANARSQAALALSKMAPASRGAVAALAGGLADAQLQVRMNSAVALCRLGPEARAAVPALLEALEDESNETDVGMFNGTIQEAVAVALGRASAGSDKGVAALVAVLKGGRPDGLRAAAARGLGAVGEPARPAVPLLTALLLDKSPQVREGAESALWSLGEGPEKMPAKAAPARKEGAAAQEPEGRPAHRHR